MGFTYYNKKQGKAAAFPCFVVIHGTIRRGFFRRGLLFAAQFARQPLLSTAHLAGCYPRHSLDFSGKGCYGRHWAKPLLFTTQFRLSAQNSCCYRRHSSVLGCYSRHNLQGLLSAAHLAEKPANPRLLVIDTPLYFCAGVVIHDTVPGVVKHGTVWDPSCCYSQHILFLGCYSRHNSETVVIYGTIRKNDRLLFPTQFRFGLLFSAQLWWVVSADTICGGSVQNSNGCYSRHNSDFLFAGCYAAHNCPPALLASAQFAPLLGTTHCFSAHSCVVRLGTKHLLRPAQLGCYPRHSSSYFLK